MEINIANTDIWNIEPMKYWTHPKSYDDARKKSEAKSMVLSMEYIGARKIDGFWGMIVKDNEGKIHLRGRTQNVQKNYVDKGEWIPLIANDLAPLPNGTAILGEIYKYGDEGSRKVTSILNCLKDKSLERQKKTPLHFYIFDVIVWDNQNLINTPIIERIKYIDTIKSLCAGASYLDYADYKEGEALWELYTDTLAQGGEGIVIQKKTAPYTCGKRTARLSLKLKRELSDTIDAFIDGDYKPATVEYTGKSIETWRFWMNQRTGEKMEGEYISEYASGEPIIPITKPYFLGYAGAISFSLMKNGKPEHLCYISSVSDNLKREIVQNPDKWIGKVFEISAMEIETAPTSKIGYTLRHARVMGLREDKSSEECDFSQLL